MFFGEIAAIVQRRVWRTIGPTETGGTELSLNGHFSAFKAMKGRR